LPRDHGEVGVRDDAMPLHPAAGER
jgi:hypothetical protein